MAFNLAREALEPFAKSQYASNRNPDIGDHETVMIHATLGDLRRARTAYDAIGSGVKALEWEKPSWGAHERAYTGVGVYRLKARDMKFFFKFEDIESPSFDTPDEAKAAAQADFERRVLSCLSTSDEADAFDRMTEEELLAGIDLPRALSSHTAAGAGPVGEAVAVPLEPTDEMLKAGIAAWVKADGEKQFRAAYRAMIAARPVEKPGEVERTTRERDEAREAMAEWKQSSMIATRRAFDAEAALAETRERLGKVEAVAVENGRAGIEAAAGYVEALWNAHTKEFGVYDYSTNVTEFSGPSEDIDSLYQELIEGIRSLDAASVDRARAALTGDAQEAGK